MTGDPETTAHKQRGKPFLPGQSGNAKGRPPGSRHVALVALDAIGEDNAKAILEAAVTAAKAGDMRATEVILSRVWPARKSRPVVLTLPAVTDAASAVAALGAITAAAADGVITLDEAQGLAALIETARRAIAARDGEQGYAEVQLINRPEGL